MKPKAIRLFTNSAGALLLAIASALFLINCTSPAALITPHDPVLGLAVRQLFWLAGSLALILALDCLFDDRLERPLFFLAWLAVNYVVYLLGVYWSGWHGLTGLLDGFSYTFGISGTTIGLLANMTFLLLLVGSIGSLWWLSRLGKMEANYGKMACPACGRHIKFGIESLGQKTSCPQCHAAITLRRPNLLKMACFFCKGHIEFPPHAIGEKMPCPHCKMDITLKEPA